MEPLSFFFFSLTTLSSDWRSKLLKQPGYRPYGGNSRGELTLSAFPPSTLLLRSAFVEEVPEVTVSFGVINKLKGRPSFLIWHGLGCKSHTASPIVAKFGDRLRQDLDAIRGGQQQRPQVTKKNRTYDMILAIEEL
jgi:hypothetical protein